MALDSAALKTAIFDGIKAQLDTLFSDPSEPPDRDSVWDAISGVIATQIVDHVVANLEIKGITVNLDPGLTAVFVAGVPAPNDGGAALQTAWQGSTTQSAVQSDDGTGHVE